MLSVPNRKTGSVDDEVDTRWLFCFLGVCFRVCVRWEEEEGVDEEVENILRLYCGSSKKAVEAVNRLRFFRKEYFHSTFIPRLLSTTRVGDPALENVREELIVLLGERTLIDRNAAKIAAERISNTDKVSI